MFGIFDDENEKVELLAPLTGEVVELSQVPDKVFAGKTVGDGVAIKPNDNKLLAPVKGVVKQLFSTNHALGIVTETGLELLIHIGMDTVELEGEGFENLVEKGNKVKPGEELIEFDLEYIREHATSIITPIVITNVDDIVGFEIVSKEEVTAGKDKLLVVSI